VRVHVQGGACEHEGMGGVPTGSISGEHTEGARAGCTRAAWRLSTQEHTHMHGGHCGPAIDEMGRADRRVCCKGVQDHRVSICCVFACSTAAMRHTCILQDQAHD